MNPNRKESPFIKYNKSEEKKLKQQSNQHTKAKRERYVVCVSDETRKKISNIWKNKKLPNEMKQKIKHTIQNKIKNNNWHLSFSKKRIIEYKGIKFHGTWEYLFALYLDNHNIEWERPTQTFDYFFENENHKYLPDFYLPKYDLYIEIKGYPTNKDYEKWNQFPCNLDIYFGDDLFNLGIINSYKNIYENVDSKFRFKHYEINKEF
jgi:hypothetical protein